MIVGRAFSYLKLISHFFYQLRCRLIYTFQPGVLIEPNVHIDKLVIIRASDDARISIKSSSVLARGACLIAKYGKLQIGYNTHIGMFSILTARQEIIIGDNCLIGEFVSIRDQDHKFECGKITSENNFSSSSIHIGNNVWIGAKATITKGVSIGDNSVVGAGAVVTSDIPKNTLSAGVPAQVIRNLCNKD